MKTFVIEEKFVGYADITIEAETEEEALALYNRGHYLDSNYNIDDMFYDYQFVIQLERKLMKTIKLTDDQQLKEYLLKVAKILWIGH